MQDLKIEHGDMVEEYIKTVNDKTQTSYMLTVARDGESPVRTIIYYSNSIEAAEAYNKYVDWGFARNFLTVRLYEPNGVINEKVLKRNQAGECTFVRQDYIDFENILLSLKDKINIDVYEDLVFQVMKVFAKDNWRFNPERFLDILGVSRKMDQ